jgi:hypothetical protein
MHSALRRPQGAARLAAPFVVAIVVSLALPFLEPAVAQSPPAEAHWWSRSFATGAPDGLPIAAPIVPLSPAAISAPADAGSEQAAAPADPTPVFAQTLGQRLWLPAGTKTIGYHESGNPLAAPLAPIGVPTVNLNVGRIVVEANAEAPQYMILPTRRRLPGPTTAVDVALDAGMPVTSPVDGIVADVTEYALYGRIPDVFIDLTPVGRPDLRVRLMHVDGPTVAPGQEVVAGESVLAHTARQLPFPSQIDWFAGPGPHVHIEVHHLTAGL